MRSMVCGPSNRVDSRVRVAYHAMISIRHEIPQILILKETNTQVHNLVVFICFFEIFLPMSLGNLSRTLDRHGAPILA